MGNGFSLIWIEPTVHAKPKLLAREGRSHLLWWAGGTTIHWMTLQHVSRLFKVGLWGELHGLRATSQPAVERSAALSSFVSHHLCMPVLRFLVPAEPSGDDGPLNIAVLASCFCCPSQYLQKCPQKRFHLSQEYLRSICASKALTGLPLQSLCTSASLRLGTWH